MSLSSSRVIETFRAASKLGMRGVLYRAPYEILNRSGLRRLLEPTGANAAAIALRGERALPYEQWLRERPPFILNDQAQVGAALLAYHDTELVLHEARDAARGTIRGFGAVSLPFGDPPIWYRDPLSGAEWPTGHWSTAARLSGDHDIKIVWEAGRFPQTFAWMRAYARTGDGVWPREFFRQVQSWIDANPFRVGIHWSNGQEIAIRVLTWLCGMYAMTTDGCDPGPTFVTMQNSLALQCRHIERHIGYAHGMRNNHLIGEALALFAAGSLLPWLKHAQRWQRIGRTLLEVDSLEQFAESGEYIQNSHTYHRLAMSYLAVGSLIAWRLGKPLAEHVPMTVVRSARLLLAHMNVDGQLPNWGENDGANFLPLTGADYTDFRPALDLALRSAGEHLTGVAGGAWEEMGTWISGPRDARSVPAGAPARSLHVIRSAPGSFATLRSAPWVGSLGHADLNHADIWMNGVNVACDTGSYLYNAQRTTHQWLTSTPAHNTVALDSASQRIRAGKWTWDGATNGTVQCDDTRVTSIVRSFVRHPHGPVEHERTVERAEKGWTVIDRVQLATAGELTLQWLLADGEWELASNLPIGSYVLETAIAQQRFRVAIAVETPSDDGRRPISIVRANPTSARGWFSRYYGVLSPGVSISLSAHTRSLCVVTTFTSER